MNTSYTAVFDLHALEIWKSKNAEQLTAKDVGPFLVENVCASASSPMPSLLALMDKLLAQGIVKLIKKTGSTFSSHNHAINFEYK